jgi:hypothetical protein
VSPLPESSSALEALALRSDLCMLDEEVERLDVTISPTSDTTWPVRTGPRSSG